MWNNIQVNLITPVSHLFDDLDNVIIFQLVLVPFQKQQVCTFYRIKMYMTTFSEQAMVEGKESSIDSEDMTNLANIQLQWKSKQKENRTRSWN